MVNTEILQATAVTRITVEDSSITTGTVFQNDGNTAGTEEKLIIAATVLPPWL